MKATASCGPANNSAPQCRTCGGKKTINVQAHKGGKPTGDPRPVTCPACRGSGAGGYLTK